MTGSGISSQEQHAVLGPSAAERWIQCPASIHMATLVPARPEPEYAREGTIAHELLKIEGQAAFDESFTPAQLTRERNAWREKWEVSEEAEEEMSEHVAACIEMLRDKVAEHPNTVIMFEQRMHTGIPSCWGTSDVVLISPIHVEIIDLKYGKGVRVDALGNPQLRLYGVGALEFLADLLGDILSVTMTVYQPRLNHVDSETITADELRAWRDSLIPLAEIALGEDAPFGPSDSACRWCPASGQCRAQLEWATQRDFGTHPELLSPAEMSEALRMVDGILDWANALKEVAMDTVYHQQIEIPGYKVVRSRGRRSIPDSEAAIDALLAKGHSIDQVSTRKVKGIGDLEKLLGKVKFQDILGPYIVKSEGSPSLVPEDDDRPSINPNDEAKKEFEE